MDFLKYWGFIKQMGIHKTNKIKAKKKIINLQSPFESWHGWYSNSFKWALNSPLSNRAKRKENYQL
jgi:hypothetical protein